MERVSDPVVLCRHVAGPELVCQRRASRGSKLYSSTTGGSELTQGLTYRSELRIAASNIKIIYDSSRPDRRLIAGIFSADIFRTGWHSTGTPYPLSSTGTVFLC